MTQFESILNELNTLEADLMSTATNLWKIKFALVSASASGHGEEDFYPRRLKTLKKDMEARFDLLLGRLQQVVACRLNRSFFVFNGRDDVVNLIRINRRIKSLHNAFARELQIGATWARLNSVLPAQARWAR